MKVGILKPILFVLLIYILGTFFIQTGTTVKTNQFYENEVIHLYDNDDIDEFATVFLNGVADRYVEKPIYSITKQDVSFSFNLDIYQYELDKVVSYLVLFSNVEAYQGSTKLDEVRLEVNMHIKSESHKTVKTLNFDTNEPKNLSPYFAIHLNDDKSAFLTTNTENSANVSFDQIYKMDLTFFDKNDAKVGQSTSIEHNDDIPVAQNETISYDETQTIQFNGGVLAYSQFEANYINSDKTLLNSYNGVLVSYIAILVVILIVLAVFMFFKEQFMALMHKIFNKNKKTVTGKVE